MILLNFILLISLVCPSWAFTDYLLKTCQQAGFCERNRFYANNIQRTQNSYYNIDAKSIQYDTYENILRASIIKTIPRKDIDDIKIVLPFELSILKELNSVRFTIDEIRQENESDLLHGYRYNETSNWSFVNDSSVLETGFLSIQKSEYGDQSFLNQMKNAIFSSKQKDMISITNDDKSIKIELDIESFQLRIFNSNKLLLVINDRALLNLEHQRSKELNFQHVLPEESTYNMFADDFAYSTEDRMTFGPESVALDFTFNQFNALFGIPEHADSLLLKETVNDEPYRLFNVDVFEYNLDSRMPMYGAIPLLLAINPTDSVGVFWNNPADTWVDIKYTSTSLSQSHIISEAGIVDVVVILGNKPSDITNSFTKLTGRPNLPLLASIGYHQCRWNYNDELDVLNVQENMDREDIPFDFIWLDLEYTDDKKYFSWKPDSFGTPGNMLKKLAHFGRELAILIDPHIKNNYEVSEAIKENDVGIKYHNGATFIGKCWPGDSVWIDTMGLLGRKVWGSFFKKFIADNLPDNINNIHIWNDMNEPSIFSGPETTAPKDLLHIDKFEERSIHNVYGLTVHETTYHSMKEIYSPFDKRPFILTRAFFAGSQRTAAVWTGDNMATWDYLRMSIPMVLTNNIVGYPFIGADVAGFAGDPEPELVARWYQTGLWYPFFRAHAHIDSQRREPYLFDEPIKSIVRNSIRLRYSLLPTFYSAFHESSVSGNPILKPMFFEYPELEELYNVDNQFYLGNYGILVKPITDPDTYVTNMIFPTGIYYDLQTLKSITVDRLTELEISAELDQIPAFIEGGHILFKRERYRRSSKLMRGDPYTITIAPGGNQGSATGKLYVDDGETFGYARGEYLETIVSLDNESMLKNTILHNAENAKVLGNTLIEKLVIAIDNDIISISDIVVIKQGDNIHEVAVHVNRDKTIATIKNPLININEPWEVLF